MAYVKTELPADFSQTCVNYRGWKIVTTISSLYVEDTGDPPPVEKG